MRLTIKPFMPAKRYKITPDSPGGADRARTLRENVETQPSTPEATPDSPQVEAAESTHYATGQEVAFSGGEIATVVRELGDMRHVRIVDEKGESREVLVSKEMLARTELRGQLTDEVMDYLVAANELDLISDDDIMDATEHATVLIDELTLGNPDELNLGKLSEQIQRTLQASVDGGMPDFAPVWHVLQETAEDRKAVIKQELVGDYHEEDAASW